MEQRRHEVEVLSRARDTEAMGVILFELNRLMSATEKTVPLNEGNWALKTAHARGYVDGLQAFQRFLLSRIGGHVNDDGSVTLGNT